MLQVTNPIVFSCFLTLPSIRWHSNYHGGLSTHFMCQGQKGQARPWPWVGEMVWVITLAGRTGDRFFLALRHVILVEMFSHYIDIIEQNKESTTSLDQLQLQSFLQWHCCDGTCIGVTIPTWPLVHLFPNLWIVVIYPDIDWVIRLYPVLTDFWLFHYNLKPGLCICIFIFQL